jgi:hypothetical protein
MNVWRGLRMLAILAAWSNGELRELAVPCGAVWSTIVTSTAAQAATATAASARLGPTKVLAPSLSRRQDALTVSRWISSALATGTAWYSA